MLPQIPRADTTPQGKKLFIPLENNPEVLNSLARDLGMSDMLNFYDVLSLDMEYLRTDFHAVVLALIFLVPSPVYWAVRAEDGIGQADDELTYDQTGDDPVMWFRQTIGNACGSMAVIHALANVRSGQHLRVEEKLHLLLTRAKPLKPKERADVLYKSRVLEKAHQKAARDGSSRAPPAGVEHVGYHFITFVRGKDDHLWELEGGSDGPVDRGPLSETSDMVSQEALEMGVRRYLKHADGNTEFSIVALA